MKALNEFEELNEKIKDKRFIPYELEDTFLKDDILDTIKYHIKGINQTLSNNIDSKNVFQHEIRLEGNKIIIEVFAKPRA